MLLFSSVAPVAPADGVGCSITLCFYNPLKKTTAFMCAEAIWWRCHRSMVSDYLKAKGWDVRHIMSIGKSQVHRYTSPAIIEGENVLYSDEE